MITAAEAYALSQKANKIYEIIGNDIKNAAKVGKTKISVTIPRGRYVSEFCKVFMDAGYTISIDKTNTFAQDFLTAPTTCTISWKPIA